MHLLKYSSDLVSPLLQALQGLHLPLDECQRVCSGPRDFIQSKCQARTDNAGLLAVPKTTPQTPAQAFALAVASETSLLKQPLGWLPHLSFLLFFSQMSPSYLFKITNPNALTLTFLLSLDHHLTSSSFTYLPSVLSH